MADRHSALVTRRHAAKAAERIAEADQQFAQHIQSEQKRLMTSTSESLSRILQAGKCKFTNQQYHPSIFSEYDDETNIETSGLLISKNNDVSDLMYPSPKIINLLTPNDAYLVRKSAIIHIKYEEDDENDTNTRTSTTTTNNNNTTEEKVPEELQEGVPIEMSYDALLIDILKKEKKEEQVTFQKLKMEKTILLEKEKNERILAKPKRSSVMSFDSSLHSKDLPTKEDDYFGKSARRKYFQDLKSYLKSDLDHEIRPTRKEEQRKYKYQRQQNKIQTLALEKSIKDGSSSNDGNNDGVKSRDEDEDKHRDEKVGKETSSKRVSFLPQVNAGASDSSDSTLEKHSFSDKRNRSLTHTTRYKTIDDLHESNFHDYTSKAATNCNETVRLSTKNRSAIEYETTNSLDRVEFRSIDPRHTYMKRCSKKDILPEPLLIGKRKKWKEIIKSSTLSSTLSRNNVLNLTHYKLGNIKMNALSPSIASMSLYQTLKLSDNRLTDTSIGPLLQILKEEQACNDTITHLDLSFNTFGSFSVKYFDPFLFSQTYLQTLNLGSALLKLKPKFRVLLFQSISKHCNSLIHLSLPSNNLNNMDAIQLSTILKLNKCSKLNVLNLAWNSITGDGIQAIAESLLTNNSLKTLNLNYNTSGNSASAFAVSLLSNTTLTSLSLESNSIDGSACIVLSEYLLETVHPLVELNLNSNNITSIGARSMLRILARGVNIKSLSFKGEYGEDSELKASFTPLYLPKTISLDLSIPFQRAQATMLLRQAAEHPGFSLLSLKYYKDINSSSCDEIHLVRQCLDLENVSIKEYKKYFMRLCRRNNPNTYFTTIDKAFIPTHQARELLKVAHNGIEPCDLMYNIIVSAFDLNDDGIIEWWEFHEGLLSARKMFGPTVRRQGQKPIGIMVNKGTKRKYTIETTGMLHINYEMIPSPLLKHNEMTRINFNKIENILKNCTPQGRIRLVRLLVRDASLNKKQCIVLCKMFERLSRANMDVLDNIVEVLLATTNKYEVSSILKVLHSTTRVQLRKHMRSHYRVLLGMYTGHYSIDLSVKVDRMVMNGVLRYYNLLVKNGLGCTTTNHIEVVASDTSQNQDWLHCANISLDSVSFSLLPHVLNVKRKEGTVEIKPLPDHGILCFDLVEIDGPDPSISVLTPPQFNTFLKQLKLDSISGIMLDTNKNTKQHAFGNVVALKQNASKKKKEQEEPQEKQEEQEEQKEEQKQKDVVGTEVGTDVAAEVNSATLIQNEIDGANETVTLTEEQLLIASQMPISCRLATHVEIVMATKISNCVRSRFARKAMRSKRRERSASTVVMQFKSLAEQYTIIIQRAFRKTLKRKEQSSIDDGSLYAPRPPFPPPPGNINKTDKNRKFLWVMNPSLRRSKDYNYFKWCQNTLGGPHNKGNSMYGTLTNKHKHFYLDNEKSRSHLENKLNHVLESVSEINMTCRQLRVLLSCLPAGVINCREECAISCFSSIVDPENLECIVLSLLTARERDNIIHRLGCLNVWTPMYMDRSYILDLTKKDQHYLSELLIKLSKEEQGDRHHFHQSYYSLNNFNEPMERPGFNYQGDSNFSNGTCPEKGIFSFRYGCSSEGPDPLLRNEYMSKCYSGRVISIQKKYQLEIKSATIIQTYIRRTIGRLRYVRANWCISIVDFATPKARNSATLIQGLFRGYKLRKMIQEGTLDVIGKMELIEMMMETEDAAQRAALRHLTPREKRRRRSCFMLDISGVQNISGVVQNVSMRSTM